MARLLTSDLPSAPGLSHLAQDRSRKFVGPLRGAVVSAGSLWPVARFAIDGDDPDAVLAKTVDEAGGKGCGI
jgi:hypothetical protein